MNFLDLKDNALFLQNWRERTRPSTLWSALLIAGIMIFLIFLNDYLNPKTTFRYDPQLMKNVPIQVEWYVKFILNIGIFQGFVLLFFGTINAYRMASRERSSGTLDFHRSSPTPRKDQLLGILLGAGSLEWIIFGCTVVLQILLTVFLSIPFWPLIKFLTALILCAFLYQACAILIGLATDSLRSRSGAFTLFFIVYLLITLSFANNYAFIHHLFWWPAYEEFSLSIGGHLHNIYRLDQNSFSMLGKMLFGVTLDSLFLQIIIQLPLFFLILKAIGNKISSFENAYLSKSECLMASFYILFLFMGSTYSILTEGHTYRYALHFQTYGSLFVLILYLGLFSAWIVTPEKLDFLRGLRKNKKLGIKTINPRDSSSTNAGWLMTYCFIAIVALFIYRLFYKERLTNSLINFTVVLNHIIAFSCFLEYFRLSRYHRKIVIFFTVLIILWVLIPSFGSILSPFQKNNNVTVIFNSFSPFFIDNYRMGDYYNSYHEMTPEKKYIPILISGFLALAGALLAQQERCRLVDSVE